MKRQGQIRRQGSTLVEFALVLPMLFLLIVNAVNFGGFLFAWITVANAARAGADYMAIGPQYYTSPLLPTLTGITDVVNADVASLPNRSSVVIRVCQRKVIDGATVESIWDLNDWTTPCPGGFPNPPNDTRAEARLYITGWVDVEYNYKPFIGGWFPFPGLNPTTIHRQAVMRWD